MEKLQVVKHQPDPDCTSCHGTGTEALFDEETGELLVAGTCDCSPLEFVWTEDGDLLANRPLFV